MKKVLIILIALITITGVKAQISTIMHDEGEQSKLPNGGTGDWNEWAEAGCSALKQDYLCIKEVIDVTQYPVSSVLKDNTGAQNSLNLNVIIDACSFVTGKYTVLYFPPGEYQFTNQIYIDAANENNIILKGDIPYTDANGDIVQAHLFFDMADLDESCILIDGREGIGIEDLKISQNFTEDHGFKCTMNGQEVYVYISEYKNKTVEYNNASNCWMTGVESYMAHKHHVKFVGNSHHITIFGCYFHESIEYSNRYGRGYGVSISDQAHHCLVENNIFRKLRHSVKLSHDPMYNVIGYNYSTETYAYNFYDIDVPATVINHSYTSDICFHGKDEGEGGARYNLVEGNIVRHIRFDDTHDGNGENNMFFRNWAIYGFTVAKSSDDNQYKQNIIGCKMFPRDLYFQPTNVAKTYGFIDDDGYWKYWYTKRCKTYSFFGYSIKSCELKANWYSLGDNQKSYYYADSPGFINPSSWPSFLAEENPAKNRYSNSQGNFTQSIRTLLFQKSIDITTNTEWDGTYWLNRDLHVKSGATLVIKPSSRVAFSSGRKLVVEQGAKLILNGCTLTNIERNMAWSGIEVWGDDTKNQANLSNQGYLKLESGALIENARIGVAVLSGGVIHAYDANFTNNNKAIIFGSYVNILPYSNRSCFKNCIFETTPSILDQSKISDYVVLIGVEGIQFFGCDFRNGNSHGHKAISLKNSSCQIKPYCTGTQPSPCLQDRCTFNGFRVAVFGVSFNYNLTTTIEECDFNNNSIGVLLYGSYNAKINKNNFTRGSDMEQRYSICLANSTGYQVEENNIQNSVYGIIVDNSGNYSNEIYKNTINNAGIALLVLGNNRINRNWGYSQLIYPGLEFLCNDIKMSLVADIAIPEGASTATNYGSCTDNTPTAGNQFSSILIPKALPFNIVKATTERLHYFYDTPNEPTMITTGITLSECSNFVNTCPSHLVGGGGDGIPIDQIVDDILTVEEEIEDLVAEIDDGRTDELVEMAAGDSPPGHIKNELVDASPYLSDEVLSTAITRDEPLPLGIIKNIIEPNAPVTDDIWALLQQLNLPPSVVKMFSSMQTGVSARTELEIDISILEKEKAVLENELIDRYLNDTTKNGMTDVITYYESKESPAYKPLLVGAYMHEKQYSEAKNVLDDITMFDEDDSTYIEFYSLLIGVYKSGRNLYQLTEAEKETLYRLDNGNTGISMSVNAILHYYYGEKLNIRIDEIEFPDSMTITGTLIAGGACSGDSLSNDKVFILDSLLMPVKGLKPAITDEQGKFKFYLAEILVLNPQAVYTLGVENGTILEDTIFKTISGWITSGTVNLTLRDVEADFTHDTTYCYGDTISMSEKTQYGLAPYSYQWDFGNGEMSIAQDNSILYDSAATYTIALSVIDKRGCSDTIIQSIIVHPQVSASFSGDTMLCSEDTIHLSNQSIGEGLDTFTWYTGSGDTLYTEHFAYKYASTGNHTVKLVAVNEFGCSDIYQDDVFVSDLRATLTMDSIVCFNSSVAIECMATGGFAPYTCLYYFGNGDTLDIVPGSFDYTYDNAGNYIITLILTDSTGCSDTVTSSITISEPPVASFDVNLINCYGETHHFIGNALGGTPPYIYNWDFGDGNTDEGQTIDYIYTSEESHFVTLTVTDANSCEGTITNVAFVPSQLVASIMTATDESSSGACDGSASTYVYGGAPPYVYHWNDPNEQNTADATNLCPGDYNFTVYDNFVQDDGALYFDGSNDRVTIPHHPDYTWGYGDFTFEAWFKPSTSQKSYPIILSKRSGNNAYSGFLLEFMCDYWSRNGAIVVQMQGRHSPRYRKGNLKDNNCHYVAAIRKSDTVHVYIDGQFMGKSYYGKWNITTNHDLWVGWDQPASGSTPFHGNIKEVRLWNKARTEEEILSNMNNFLKGDEQGLIGYFHLNEGNGQIVTDYSLNGNDGYLGSNMGTDGNDPRWSIACPLNAGISCTATDSVTIYSASGASKGSSGKTEGNSSMSFDNTGELPPEGFIDVYPNPYSESTKIVYHLGESSDVLIEVYDLTGRKITTILKEKQEAGVYEYKFSAKELGYPSGVYMLNLKMNDVFTSYRLVETDY